MPTRKQAKAGIKGGKPLPIVPMLNIFPTERGAEKEQILIYDRYGIDTMVTEGKAKKSIRRGKKAFALELPTVADARKAILVRNKQYKGGK